MVKAAMTALVLKSRESDFNALVKQLQVIVPEYHPVTHHLNDVTTAEQHGAANVVSFPQSSKVL